VFHTYLKFFSKKHMAVILRAEAGNLALNSSDLKALAFYHLDGAGLPFMKTLTRRYYFSTWPYYILLVNTPFVLLACIFLARREDRKFIWLLLVISSAHVTVVQALGAEPSPRHLHAVTVLLLPAAGFLSAQIAAKIRRVYDLQLQRRQVSPRGKSDPQIAYQFSNPHSYSPWYKKLGQVRESESNK
jgi:hypothetical protein